VRIGNAAEQFSSTSTARRLRSDHSTFTPYYGSRELAAAGFVDAAVAALTEQLGVRRVATMTEGTSGEQPDLP
jgi:hypothetical protein